MFGLEKSRIGVLRETFSPSEAGRGNPGEEMFVTKTEML